MKSLLVAVAVAAVAALPARALAAPVTAAAASATTGEAPAGPGPDTWTVTAGTLDVTTGPADDLVVTIDYELWVPASATTATPAPAVLTTHGFGNTKDVPEQLANAAYFASHGYVVLSYTSQGFGGSSSCIGLDSLDYDVKNAQALLDHLASLDFVALDAPGDPKVGMVGGSYGGGAQGLIAATDGRVDAIAIGRSWHTLQYSLDPNNWIPAGADPWDLDVTEQGVFKQVWTSLFFTLGASTPATGGGGCDPVTQQTEFPGQPPCPGFVPAICPTFARLTATGDASAADRELVGRSSLATVIDQLDTPTLLLQGQPDTLFTPNEAVATYVNLAARGVPTAMIWHSGGHGGYDTGSDEAEAYSGQWTDEAASQAEFTEGYLPRRTLQWFEKHVRGRDVDTGPGFAWHRDWSDAVGAAAYGAATTYPAGEVRDFVLDPAADALTPAGTAFDGGDATFLSPPGGEPAAYSELPNFSSPGDTGDQPATEVEGQYVGFETAPFEADIDVVGVPMLRLRLSHQVPTDLRVFAKLYDVAPDGTETLIRRMVAPARIPTDALAEPVDLRMVGIAWRVAAGHRLRVVLASTDQSYWNQRLADVITVSSTPDAPSTLALPVVQATPDTADDPIPDDPASGDGPAAPDEIPALPATGGGAALLAVVLVALAAAIRQATATAGRCASS